MDIAYSVKGRARHELAKVLGRTRDESELPAIARTCANCLSLKLVTMRVTGKRYGFCGPVGENYTESVLPTCGCEVMQETSPAKAHVTIEGVPLRASGKPETGHCPQGRW